MSTGFRAPFPTEELLLIEACWGGEATVSVGVTLGGLPIPRGRPHTHAHRDGMDWMEWIIINSLKRREAGRELYCGYFSGELEGDNRDRRWI